ncbi:DUF5615 family PIN-like protein [Candidatus Daviesbacteria bacterium]|nr:DUF5615 family PIN-like protein [Candidatus Daviesbacteria bacterium]
MVKKFHKHKLLLDENFDSRKFFPHLNSRFDIKHLSQDLKQIGLKDPDVHKYAIEQERIIITFNIKDFKPLAPLSNKTGVIGVSANMSLEDIDKKLTALLNKSSKKSLLGKLTLISGETEKLNNHK